MKNRYCNRIILIIASILLSLCNVSYAACVKTPSVMNIGEATSAPLNFGTIYYSSNDIQPAGTILGHIVIPPKHKALAPDTVLWTCDKSDLHNIYFLVATSGWNSFGGSEDLGDGIYATWFRHIGLKQTMDGITLSRYWQKIPIKKYKLDNNKIKIRLMDIPKLEATLVKVGKLPSSRKATEHCNSNMAIAGTYSKASIFGGGSDNCKTASAFVQLSGNTSVNIPFAHDQVGEDSYNHNKFFYGNNGILYGLGNSNTTLVQNYTCLVRTKTPLIKIPSISATEIKNSISTAVNFNLELECNDNFQSGINPTQIAMGFLPSNNAQNQAKNLNLLTNNGTSEFLISENYNQANTAKGVGLVIKNPTTLKNINFLAPNAPTGGGNAAGWYPIIDSNTISTKKSGSNLYNKEYRAVLQKLPNQTPTPGLFKATATIMVKIQ